MELRAQHGVRRAARERAAGLNALGDPHVVREGTEVLPAGLPEGLLGLLVRAEAAAAAARLRPGPAAKARWSVLVSRAVGAIDGDVATRRSTRTIVEKPRARDVEPVLAHVERRRARSRSSGRGPPTAARGRWGAVWSGGRPAASRGRRGGGSGGSRAVVGRRRRLKVGVDDRGPPSRPLFIRPTRDRSMRGRRPRPGSGLAGPGLRVEGGLQRDVVGILGDGAKDGGGPGCRVRRLRAGLRRVRRREGVRSSKVCGAGRLGCDRVGHGGGAQSDGVARVEGVSSASGRVRDGHG